MKEKPPLDQDREHAPAPVLQARDLSRRFGGMLAVDRVSLSVKRGAIVGLVGPNGAGKSTLFDMLAGARAPSAGRIFLQGQDVTTTPAHTRLAAGLGRTFQIPRPFARMSVLENVMLGRQRQRGEQPLANLWARGRVAAEERACVARARDLLDVMTLTALAEQPARVLSGGQRKLLELARVLMAEPTIVLLDEPAAGVSPALLETIIDRIAALNRDGTTFLIIEHNMEMVTRLCDHLVVMAGGRVLCEGPPGAMVSDPRVIEAYLGSAVP